MERTNKPVDKNAPLKPACSDCYFHDTKLAPDKSIKTLCRYDLPTLAHVWIPVEQGMTVVSQILWRVVEPTDWCGKFSIDKPTN